MDDALSPLEFCLANEDGICEFDAFVEVRLILGMMGLISRNATLEG